MTPRRLAVVVAWIAGILLAFLGAWAFLSPHSFFVHLAHWPPYNRHLFHDVGAFQLGLAAGLLAGAAGRSGLAVGLWGGAVGASVHALSHWIDADHGGRSTDPAFLTIPAAVLVIALIAAERRR
ncbi:MAG: hypothetical protein ABR600_05980 [Actinomycetota bacterium]|nr:hypothetical protein [Actinomycetota bacterium]